MKTALHKTIISFFGPPGSGKGTLAERVISDLGFAFLSTGNLCRKHVALGTPLGQKLDVYLKQGSLIPDELITEMVTDWLKESVHENKPIILDGYPRTKGQAAGLLTFVNGVLKDYCFRVFFISLSDEEIIKRLSSRKLCSNKDCQAIYSGDESLEVCKLCGGILIRRSDDNTDVVEARLKAYPKYKDALLNYYQEARVCVEDLDVTGMSRDQVFNTFKAML